MSNGSATTGECVTLVDSLHCHPTLLAHRPTRPRRHRCTKLRFTHPQRRPPCRLASPCIRRLGIARAARNALTNRAGISTCRRRALPVRQLCKVHTAVVPACIPLTEYARRVFQPSIPAAYSSRVQKANGYGDAQVCNPTISAGLAHGNRSASTLRHSSLVPGLIAINLAKNAQAPQSN